MTSNSKDPMSKSHFFSHILHLISKWAVHNNLTVEEQIPFTELRDHLDHFGLLYSKL